MKNLQYFSIFLLMSLLLTSCDEYDSYEQCVDSRHHRVCTSSSCSDRSHKAMIQAHKKCFITENPCSESKVEALSDFSRCRNNGCSKKEIEDRAQRLSDEYIKYHECVRKRVQVCVPIMNQASEAINCVSEECRIETAKFCSKYPKKK